MKSLVVSVCITAVTDMAAVSLLVFFWCSSGFFWVLLAFFWRSSGVLLAFFCVIEHQKNARRTPEEHQKNTRRTPEEPRRTQKNPEGEEHQPPRLKDILPKKKPKTADTPHSHTSGPVQQNP